MPELPEVETIKLVLQRKIVGKTIKDIEILSTKSFIGNNGQPFDSAQGLRGRKVLNVWRKAKYLGIELDSGPASRGEQARMTLLIHLKMTGQLIYENKERFMGGHPTEDMMGKMPNPHTRVIFIFSDNSKLYFNDQRRFGWIKVIVDSRFRGNDNENVISDGSNVISDRGVISDLIGDLGPEPLEQGFTWKILKNNLLRHKSMPVKVAIMDQSVVSGVGNIYSNEACFNARLDPRKKVGELIDKEFKSLHQGVLKALRDGIAHGGSTRAHFRDPEGHKGYFLDYAYVYGLDKHPCKVCKTIIKKIQLGGRGTYFCERCQS